MHIQLWNKYLPIIKILLKRSIAGNQTLQLNVTDFERAGIIRKSGNKFSLSFTGGKADVVIPSELAKDLAYVLLQDATVKELFMQNNYTISLNTKYSLAISLVPKAGTEEEPVTAAESVMEKTALA